MLMDADRIEIPNPGWYDVFATFMGDNRDRAFALIQKLRSEGIRADMDHCGRSLKAQFKYANKTGAPLTAVIGDEEAANGTVKIKQMSTGTEVTVPVDQAADSIRSMLRANE